MKNNRKYGIIGALIPLQKKTYFNMNNDERKQQQWKNEIKKETTKSKELKQWKDKTIEYVFSLQIL